MLSLMHDLMPSVVYTWLIKLSLVDWVIANFVIVLNVTVQAGDKSQ